MAKLTMLLMSFILVLVVGQPVRAKTMPVQIAADHISYVDHTKSLECNGNVVIKYQDLIIKADYATIDQNQEVLLAKNKVSVIKDDYTLQGDSLLYYFQKQEGRLSPAQTLIKASAKAETLKITAEEVLFEEEVALLQDTWMTGCDLAKPHYHFTAKRVKYYPEQRIVFYHVWYHEHGLKLLYLPYYVLPLNNDNRFEFNLGWSEQGGWDLYLGYNYALTDHNYGKFKSSLTEKKGNKFGLEHITKLTPKSKFSQEYSLLDRGYLGNPHRNYSYRFAYENRDFTKLKLDASLLNWRYHTLAGEPYDHRTYQLNLTGLNTYPSLYSKYQITGLRPFRVLDVNSYWSTKFWANTNLFVKGRFLEEIPDAQAARESFNYRISLTKRWSWSNLQVDYNETKLFNNPNTIINQRPNIVWTVPKWQLPLIGPVKLVANYKYQETLSLTNFNNAGIRMAYDLTKLPVTLWQNQKLQLTLNSQFKYREVYTHNDHWNGSEMYGLSGGIAFVDRFTKHFRTEVHAGYTQKWGGIRDNYFGDYLYNGTYLDNLWKWQSQHLTATLKTGYIVETDTKKPIDLTLYWSPSPKERLSFKTTYDWVQELGQTDLSLKYNPNPQVLLAVNLGYNPRYVAPWTRREFEVQTINQLTTKIRSQIISRYDFFRNGFSDAKIRLIFDLHCRQLAVDYDWVAKRYQLQLVFKAFPDLPLALNPPVGGQISF